MKRNVEIIQKNVKLYGMDFASKLDEYLVWRLQIQYGRRKHCE